jgi:hypothetical protein
MLNPVSGKFCLYYCSIISIETLNPTQFQVVKYINYMFLLYNVIYYLHKLSIFSTVSVLNI